MEKKIQVLYQKLVRITFGYLIYQEKCNIELIKTMIPQIQEYALWFMEENRFCIEEKLYQELKINLLAILQDIVMALEQGDRVLLNDAIAYGLLDYLELSQDSGEETWE